MMGLTVALTVLTTFVYLGIVRSGGRLGGRGTGDGELDR